MSRIIVALAALTAGLVWTVRRLAYRPGVPDTTSESGNRPALDQVWRDAERETIVFRMRSGPGLL